MARIVLPGATAIRFSTFSVTGLQRTRTKIPDAGQSLADLVSTPEEGLVIGRKRHGGLPRYLKYI